MEFDDWLSRENVVRLFRRRDNQCGSAAKSNDHFHAWLEQEDTRLQKQQ